MKRSISLWVLFGLSLCPLQGRLRGDTRLLTEPVVHGVVFPEVAPTDGLGAEVAGIGDLNGDGIGDMAILAPGVPAAIYLVLGRREWPGVFDLAAEGSATRIPIAPSFYGAAFAGAGDLDRDGFWDAYILVGRTGAGPAAGPRLYLLYGGAALPPQLDLDEIGVTERGAVFTGSELPDAVGHNLLAAPSDFNGDGVPDLAIGNPNAIGPRAEKGLLTILFGARAREGAQDLGVIAALGEAVRILGSQFPHDVYSLGHSIASAGDVNGDGLSDLAASDTGLPDAGGVPVGGVCLIYGARDLPPLLESAKLGGRGVTILGGAAQDVFGGGDLDGDGLAELGFSLFEYTDPATKGRLMVVRGGRELPSTISIASIAAGTSGFEIRPVGLRAQAVFGYEAAMAPDEDGDGRSELLVGKDFIPGEVLVLRGQYPIPPGAVDAPLHRFLESSEPRFREGVGRIAAPAGDVNGDGTPDYLIGSPDVSFDPAQESFAFLLFGGFETRVLSIDSVSPKRGPIGKSISVDVTGTGFADGARVFFGDQPAADVKVLDPHTLAASTPIIASARTVDVAVVHPDGRRAVLPSAFTFREDVRRLSLPEIPGVVVFEARANESLVPDVLGDVNGDGLEDYAFRVNKPGRPAHLVYGGTRWEGRVAEPDLAERSVRFHPFGNDFVELAPMADLDRDGRAEYAVLGRAQFAVLFESFDAGADVDPVNLESDPSAAYFSTGNDESLYGLAHLGDFDGDGEGDLIAHAYTTTAPAWTRQLVLIRGPIRPGDDVVIATAGGERVVRILDGADPLYFGQNFGPMGDFNGDGRSDLAIFEPATSEMLIALGHAPRSDALDVSDLEAEGKLLRIPHQPGSFQFLRFSRAGDVNGDGFGDVLVNGGGGNDDSRGSAGVLLGRKAFAEGARWESEVSGAGGFLLHGTEPVQLFGNDAATGMDLDGDARPDLVVGSPKVTELRDVARPGLVHIVHGIDDLRGESAITEVDHPLTVIEGEAPADRFGTTVRALGDQDGDGLPELLVEAAYWSLNGPSAIGKTFLIPGAGLFGPARFRRGDADGSGKVALTDAVVVLGYLFLGDKAPSCLDAADGDDSGGLNISDAIYILGWLFLGGPEPPPPGSNGCGLDPTADALVDCSYDPGRC